MKIRVLLADDHMLFRKGLKMILEETPDMVVAGEAGSGQEAIDRVSESYYDVVLLDLSMPGKEGLEVLKEVKKIKPELPVLVLTMHPEDQYAVRVLRAGASGYLTKKNAPDEVVAAVRKVFSGRKYISPSLAEKLAVEITEGSEQPLHKSLSDREFEVFRLIASGKSLTDIAKGLSLSINTVSTYRARILDKLNMKNNAEIIHYAIKNRIIE